MPAWVGTRDEIDHCKLEGWKAYFNLFDNLKLANKARKRQGLIEKTAAELADAMAKMCDFEQTDALEEIESEKRRYNE